PAVDPRRSRPRGRRPVRRHDRARLPHPLAPAVDVVRGRAAAGRRDGRELRVEPRALPGARALGLARPRHVPRRAGRAPGLGLPGDDDGDGRTRGRRQAGLRRRARVPLLRVSRTVLVTGAARGIGAAIATRLAADGWGVHAVAVADGDLATREGNRAVVDAALERFDGRLDAVVANAGFQHVAPVRDFPEEQWERLQALLLTSPFLLAKYAWDALAASGD